MLNWPQAGRHERRLQETLNLVFRNHPNLLEFLFESKRAGLKAEPAVLLVGAGVFSSGEKILVRLGLDLWCGGGQVSLWDIIERLDQENYRNVLIGLRHLRRSEPDGSEMVWRQPKTAYWLGSRAAST